MNFLQRTVAKLFRIPTLTPRTNTRRYGGATMGNASTSGWLAWGTSADSEIWSSLKIIRDRARSLYNDDPYIQGAVNGIVENVVDSGIKLQAKVKNRAGYDIKTNSLIEQAWENWAENPKFCHTAGKLNLYEMQEVITSSSFISGEILIRLVRQSFEGSPIPLALELIEADQLDDKYTSRQSQYNNQIRMGVEVDQWLKPVAYWILPNHPGDVYFGVSNVQPLRIPADEIIHFYNMTGLRPGQTRGISALHSVILRARNINGYEEAEVLKARGQAQIAGFYESEYPEAYQIDEDGAPVDYLEAGTIKRLRPGEKFSGFDPSSPNPNLPAFLKHLLRATAIGTGISYYTQTGDYESTSFSSVRAALLSERKRYRIRQNKLIRKFLKPLYYEWLDLAVLSGVLPLQNYETKSIYYRQHTWAGVGWEWIDPLKDQQASQLGIAVGTSTITRELAKLGLDLEEVLIERQQEIMLYKKYGIPLPPLPNTVIPDQPDEELTKPEPQT